MIILASYHGEVPLLIYIPGVRGFGVKKQVGLIDLAPTIMSLLGYTVPHGVDGRDISGCMKPGQSACPDRPLFAQYDGNAAVIAKDWKLIRRRPKEAPAETLEGFHSLVDDREERTNLINRYNSAKMQFRADLDARERSVGYFARYYSDKVSRSRKIPFIDYVL